MSLSLNRSMIMNNMEFNSKVLAICSWPSESKPSGLREMLAPGCRQMLQAATGEELGISPAGGGRPIDARHIGSSLSSHPSVGLL
jgi:hypothetical protein